MVFPVSCFVWILKSLMNICQTDVPRSHLDSYLSQPRSHTLSWFPCLIQARVEPPSRTQKLPSDSFFSFSLTVVTESGEYVGWNIMNYVEVKVPQIHTKKEIIPLLHSIINMIYIYWDIHRSWNFISGFMLSLSLPYFSKTSLLLLEFHFQIYWKANEWRKQQRSKYVRSPAPLIMKLQCGMECIN